MKVLGVNDIHASDRPPSSCTESYMDDIFDLLEETVDVAEAQQVDAVTWTGDVFNSKAPSRNSHYLVNTLADIGMSYKCPWYIVPGNHDITHDDLGSLDKQPLGGLYRAGARQLIGRCREFPHLYGVPWQQDWSNEAVGEALREWREDGGPTHRGLVVTHAPLYPPGLELPYEFYDAVMFASAMGNRGSCLYGHVHEYHGTWEAAGVMFSNPGALSRGSLHEHNLTRPVLCVIWDSEDAGDGLTGFAELALHAKPAEEVFRLREKQEIADTTGKLDEFLAGVGGTKLEVLSIETVLEHVRSRKLGKDIEDEVAELLDWAVHQE